MAVRQSKAATIATVIVALLAAVAIFVLVYVTAQTKLREDDFQQEVIEEYIPDESLSDEMKDAAANLIKSNYQVIKLFYIKALPHLDEPYGNAPEDGIYTVDIENSDYKSLEEIEALVRATYETKIADSLLNEAVEGEPMYLMRGDDLGINANYSVLGDNYTVDWTSGNVDFNVEPSSAIECSITINVKDKSGNSLEKEASMLKLNGVWYLENIIL